MFNFCLCCVDVQNVYARLIVCTVELKFETELKPIWVMIILIFNSIFQLF